ncbi:MAG TPA: diacylglycerol kinase family protein [Solirubrobacteraceae bacterium]|nr:diacylglycerol kinase family protein [Solirubrobacteraceae bacterium]
MSESQASSAPPRDAGQPTPATESFHLPPLATKKRMLIIVNPYASTVSDNLRQLVVHALKGRFEVDAVDTEARGHATELCREAAHEGYDVIVAFGGDGTVNEAANGLLGISLDPATGGPTSPPATTAASPTPLTCLPGGSANVFGRMLGIPGELVDATEHLLRLADDWRPRTVDVGVVNGRCFTFASGLGLDASVVRRVDANPHLKARLGPWYFTWVAVGTFARRYLLRPPHLDVRVAGERHAGVTAIVQNGSPFTYFRDRPIEIAEDAALDSGTLSGCVLRRARPIDMPSIAWRAFSRRARLSRHRQITGFTGAHELTVSSADGKPLPLQVDGDYLGEVEQASYSILPRALTVLG